MSGGEEPGPRKWTLEEWKALFGDYVGGGMPDYVCSDLASEELAKPFDRADPCRTRRLLWQARLRNDRYARLPPDIEGMVGDGVRWAKRPPWEGTWPPGLQKWLARYQSTSGGKLPEVNKPFEISRNDMICVITLQELCGLTQGKAIKRIAGMARELEECAKDQTIKRAYQEYKRDNENEVGHWILTARNLIRDCPPDWIFTARNLIRDCPPGVRDHTRKD